MPNIYLIAGCNGAGKTTTSKTVLIEILDCKEFVNADNIAVGLSPFQPESVSFEAGRLMLQRIDFLVQKKKMDFAIETTLFSRNYIRRFDIWKSLGYKVVLIYIWLKNTDIAIERIRQRVKKGGHSVPDELVIRRYYKGIKNLFDFFIPNCDRWYIINNSEDKPVVIAEGIQNNEIEIFDKFIWNEIKELRYGK